MKTDILLEVVTDSGSRCFIIPYKEWLIIKEWYCDTSSTNDYYLTLDSSNGHYSIVRLDKKISEIRVHELTHSSTLSKNLRYILLSAVPRGMKFITAFLINLAMWAAFGIFALIKGAEINKELVFQIMKLTSVIFVIFMLFNIEFIIIKIVDISKHKYKAFITENEGSFAGTLVFNFTLLFFFALIGTENVIFILSKLWQLLGLHF